MNIYEGRIIKLGLDLILDNRGFEGIEEAIAMRCNLKKPITEDECLKYLDYKNSIQCLDICRNGYAYERINIGKYRFARDIDHYSYILYDDLCQAMPSSICLEDYGEDILRRCLKDVFIDRKKGTHQILLYCPSSFIVQHFILAGNRSAYEEHLLNLSIILERIPNAIHEDNEFNQNDLMHIHPVSPYSHHLI